MSPRDVIVLSVNSVFFQAEDGIRDGHVTGVQTCALPICADPETDQALAESDRAQAHRRESKHIHRPEVQTRLAAVKPADSERRRPFVERIKRQQEVLRLPLFPTTTIGSFPQTDAIRDIRRDYKAGHCSAEQYQQRIGDAIADAVARQEALGLDVLVHGEAERNDMVEYFGEQLEGFAFTRFGWVQSYGSRCVKPPIIYGDVVRPHALTVDWWRFAQDLTDRPVKGMLTGPITMLGWSSEERRVGKWRRGRWARERWGEGGARGWRVV